MSTKTDVIAGSALLSMLEGMQDDRKVEKAREAEIVRTEGLARLKNQITDQESLSGYVDKTTGKDIKQRELASYPAEKKMTKADYAIEQTKKLYIADRDMKAEDRDKLRLQEEDDLKFEAKNKLAVEEAKQRGLTRRKGMDILEEKASKELKNSKDKRDYDLKIANLKLKLRPQYEEYLAENEPEEKGLLSKTLSRLKPGEDKDEPPKLMTEDEYYASIMPNIFGAKEGNDNELGSFLTARLEAAKKEEARLKEGKKESSVEPKKDRSVKKDSGAVKKERLEKRMQLMYELMSKSQKEEFDKLSEEEQYKKLREKAEK